MPIPPFDRILNVLPPHIGNPTRPSDLSPYPCTTAELCSRFAAYPVRKQILRGFLALRRELMQLGVQGFQWLDGSFCEDIEAMENRNPADLDVVSFVAFPRELAALHARLGPRPQLWNRRLAKATYRVDHFLLPLGSAPELIVEHTRYWCGLFSHRRDRTWKGMLRVELTAPDADASAWQVLGGEP